MLHNPGTTHYDSLPLQYHSLPFLLFRDKTSLHNTFTTQYNSLPTHHATRPHHHIFSSTKPLHSSSLPSHLYLHKSLRHPDDTQLFNSVTTHHSAIPSHLYHRKTLPHITITKHHDTIPLRFITLHCFHISSSKKPQPTLFIFSFTKPYLALPGRYTAIQFRYGSLPLFTTTPSPYVSRPFITLTLHHNSLPLLSILFYLPHKGTSKVRSAIHKHTHLWAFPYNHLSVFTNGYLTYPTHHMA